MEASKTVPHDLRSGVAGFPVLARAVEGRAPYAKVVQNRGVT